MHLFGTAHALSSRTTGSADTAHVREDRKTLVAVVEE
jgi:hypothetical protein